VLERGAKTVEVDAEEWLCPEAWAENIGHVQMAISLSGSPAVVARSPAFRISPAL
jgi:hypothetical protein